MARHPRLILPGVAVHVVQRGNNRSACFGADGDYLAYMAHLAHLSRKYECEIHAYCLMTNHVHLLLTAVDPVACGLLMRDLGRCYVPYFNRRYGRTGTLWEGRFRSCVAESARYVLACYRYIELNPVRASMVSEPAAHRWSSHTGNIGMARGSAFDTAQRISWYPLVSEAFKSQVLTPSGCRTERGKPGPRVEAPEAVYDCEPGWDAAAAQQQ
jgi:REP element-mobilizing transposase RayT